MRHFFMVLVLAGSVGCSVTAQPSGDAGPSVSDGGALSCMDVWNRFDAREASFRLSCVHQRTFDFDDNGCLNGTQPTPSQLASCGAQIDAATDCESLADAMRRCEGGSTSASACGETVHIYDTARGSFICPYTWRACPVGVAAGAACASQLGAATDCASLDAAAAACAR